MKSLVKIFSVISAFISAHTSFIFYLSWFFLGLLQAGYTELLHDEAYYWQYASHPAWGYFDHPPMIAWLIYIGSWFFEDEIGVRLLPVILNTTSIYILEKLLIKTEKKIFYVVISSTAILQLAGILAVPDSPLLFFSFVFYSQFKRFLENSSLKNGSYLALAMSALVYSKYHGILLIIISLGANPGLFRKKSLWLSLTLLFVFMLPHLHWQYQNNFPSISYHWLERGDENFSLWLLFNYLFSLPFVYGPFTGFWFIYALFTFKPGDDYEKTIRLNGIISLLLFLLLSLKGRIEANWTFIALLPLIYTGIKRAESQRQIQILLWRLFPFTLLIILLLRVYMVWDFLPVAWNIKTEFHNNKTWALQIKQLAGGRPVAFMNSYQYASKYAFYSGEPSFSLNNVAGRRNQYTIWDSEYSFQGENIILVTNYESPDFNRLETVKGRLNFVAIPNFRSYGNTRIETPVNQLVCKQNSAVQISVKIKTFNSQSRNTAANPIYPAYLSYSVFQKNTLLSENKTSLLLTNNMINNEQKYTAKLTFTLPPGEYTLLLGTKSGWLPSQAGSKKIKLFITTD